MHRAARTNEFPKSDGITSEENPLNVKTVAAGVAAAAMKLTGEGPFLALGHRFPASLPGRGTLAEALYRHRGDGPPVFARLRDGLKLSVPRSREGVSLSLVGGLIGNEEERIYAMFARFLRPGDVFFDVGSHLGFYSMTAAALTAPDGTIHAFDAQPWIVEHLRRSMSENRLGARVTVNHAAVVAADGASLKIYPSRSQANTGSASIMEHEWVDTAAGVEIAGLSLDAYVRRAGVTRIDAMKMDIEGAELDALKGMTRILSEMPPRLMMIELMIGDDGLDRASADGAREAMEIMTAAGYGIHEIRPDGRLGRKIGYKDLAAMAIANLGFAAAGLRADRPDMFES